MPVATHPDLKLSLVTLACLLAAWGPVFAAIAWGVASGLRAARNDRTVQKPKSRG
jgi:hypothetical protein